MTIGTYGSRVTGAGTPTAGNAGWNGRGGNTSDGFTPMQLWRRLHARRRLLLKTATLAFFGIAAGVFLLTPRYTGSARILVEAPPSQIVNPLDNTRAPFADREKVASEIQVLLSRALAEKAIEALKLDENPEFDRTLPNASRLDRLKTEIFGTQGRKEEIVARYYDRLKVYQVGTSRVIAVDFSSDDPETARDAANKVAELYIEDQRETLLDVNSRSRGWLSEQIDDLRARIALSENKVEEFRAETGLLEGTGTQLQTQELTELNSQLSAARAARAEAEARVANLQRVVGNGAPPENINLDSVLEVLQSPLIQQLRASEVQLKRELTEMSAQLLPSHPNMIRKEAEVKDLGAQIHAEIQKVIAGLRNQARFSEAREASLQRDLERMKGTRAEANRDQIALRALEREAAADRNLLETFLGRFAEVSARGDLSLQEANARIISPAPLPEVPSSPQTVPLLALGLLIAFGAGLSAVVMAELTGRTVRYARDIEAATGLPVLAVIPAVKRPAKDDSIIPTGESYAEGIRTLHAGLGVTPSRNQRGRMILLTSTTREEGRTTTALALARSMAQAGLRVLLIDADFDNANLSRQTGFKADQVGFSDLLAGRAGYDHVIVQDKASTVQIISAGKAYQVSVLASPRFQPIMEGLVRAYDVVLVDSAPVSRSSDPQMLARIADQCLYAVRWNKTEREAMAGGLRRLAISGMRSGGIGIVMTRAQDSALA